MKITSIEFSEHLDSCPCKLCNASDGTKQSVMTIKLEDCSREQAQMIQSAIGALDRDSNP